MAAVEEVRSCSRRVERGNWVCDLGGGAAISERGKKGGVYYTTAALLHMEACCSHLLAGCQMVEMEMSSTACLSRGMGVRSGGGGGGFPLPLNEGVLMKACLPDLLAGCLTEAVEVRGSAEGRGGQCVTHTVFE